MADTEYTMVAPSGESLKISEPLFAVFRAFLKGVSEPSGRVTVDFRRGQICNVEGSFTKVYNRSTVSAP